MKVSLNVSVLPETKVAIEALAAMLQRPSGAVVDLITASYVASLPEKPRAAVAAISEAAGTDLDSPPTLSTSTPIATYRFSRLCFRRDIIESLAPNEAFQVITPAGSFRMTKSEFHREFQNVVESKSYREDGIYHYPKLPARAERFRVR